MLHKEYYYTLRDFYNQNDNNYWITALGADESFSSLLGSYSINISPLAYEGFLSTYSTIMDRVFEVLKMRHKNAYCYVIERRFDETERAISEDDCIELLSRFVNIFNLTMPRYLSLLKAYQDNAATPIQKISSETTGKTRFNDTPQSDDLTDGYYSDDDHATNVTAAVTETKTDPAALYEQLDKLYSNWRSIVRDWADEFDGLYIDGVNLL